MKGPLGRALEENRGPHLTAVLLTDGSQVCIVYPTLDPKPFRAALAFPSLRRFLTRRTCLLAPGKNSAAPKRTFSSALVSAGWRAQRENDRRKERGIWAGHSKRIVGPT